MNLIDLSELLERIKGKVEIELYNYESLKKLLYHNLFCKIPVFTNKINKGEIIYRTVPVSRSDITMGRKKYVSYRPKEIPYPYFNRCSEPEQTHFYCSTNRHLSIAECSYFISEIENHGAVFDKESERLEVGMWEAMVDIYVVDLRFGNFTHPGTEKFQIDLKEKYKDFAKEKYVSDFFDYINYSFELPVKKSQHLRYWLTACYSSYVFYDDFKPQKDWGTMTELNDIDFMPMSGILYHSTKGIKTDPPIDGYNLALKTELIDNNSLRLVKAGIFETKQISEKEFTFDSLIKLNKNISGDSWYYDDPKQDDLK